MTCCASRGPGFPGQRVHLGAVRAGALHLAADEHVPLDPVVGNLLPWREGYTGCPKTGWAKFCASWKSRRYGWGSVLATTLGLKARVHTM